VNHAPFFFGFFFFAGFFVGFCGSAGAVSLKAATDTPKTSASFLIAAHVGFAYAFGFRLN
jgi:hypothetical protein